MANGLMIVGWCVFGFMLGVLLQEKLTNKRINELVERMEGLERNSTSSPPQSHSNVVEESIPLHDCRELLAQGRAVAHDILADSTYSGDRVIYWNRGKARSSRLALFAEGNLLRLREFTSRAAEEKVHE